MQEKFAGFAPGELLVLAVDPTFVDKVSDETLIKEFALTLWDPLGYAWEDDDDREEKVETVLAWLDMNGIELKGVLGSGSFGTAFLVDSEEHGKDIVLKVSSHKDEMICVKWIFDNPHKSKHLPQIFEFGEIPTRDFSFSRRAFFYLRPLYAPWPKDIKYLDELNLLKDTKEKIKKETGGVFNPWDLKKSNIGFDDDGNTVYFDPACSFNISPF